MALTKEERQRETQMAGKRATEKRRESCHSPPPFPTPPPLLARPRPLPLCPPGSVGTAVLWRGEIAKARPRVACMDTVVTSALLTNGSAGDR